MLAITNAKIHTMVGPVIEKGTIVIEDGKITAVGADVKVPDGAQVVDAKGRHVSPGIIEAHGHAGVYEAGNGWAGADGNEATHPITPQVRAIDGANPEDTSFADFRKHGVTAMHIMPGSANLIGGECFVVKHKEAATIDEMILLWPSGMKAALGENPKRVYGTQKKAPATRMGNAAMMREWLQKAKDYAAKKKKAAEDEDAKEPNFDMKLEALVPVINGEMPMHIHCHRQDDIATAIRIAGEFGVKYTLEHATLGHKVVDLLKENDVSCAVGPSMYFEGKVEVVGIGFDGPATLHEHGVHFCLTNDHPVIHARYLRVAAGQLEAEGVPGEDALKSITIWAAEHIGVADRIGSIEQGKDADLVIWSGEPLDARSRADVTMIDGKVVFERE